MQSSRPEAEERLRRSLALSALAEAENLKVDEEEIEAKLKEVKRQLSGERDIDPQRLRDAVVDELLRDKLLGWLEENGSITEKVAATPTEDKDTAAKAAAPID
jgi:trigger factor